MKHSNQNIFTRIFSPDVFVWFYPLLLILPNVVLDITESTSAISKIANIALPLGIYMLLMGLWRNVGRTSLILFPVLFYGAFQIVLIYLYGESIIAVDMFLNLATTNVSEATELLRNLVMAIVTVCVVYVPSLIWGIVLLCRKSLASASNLRVVRIAGISTLVVGAFVTGAAYIADSTFGVVSDIFPANVIENTVIAVQRTKATAAYHLSSGNFSYKARSTRPKSEKEVYVLVVGETSRADNWQLLGYDRPTNPKLSRRHDLITFGKAVSESNTTHKSVPLMLSWVSADNFGDSIYTTKSIISAFKDAGFATAYFSNQGRNHSFIDFFGEEADSTVFLADGDGERLDMRLVGLLNDFVEKKNDDKKFIVLHTYGSHFNYQDRYPETAKHFLPDDNANAEAENRPTLMNAYDNSICYTDCVLDSIICTLERQGCMCGMMYLSDHGEDIFDDSRDRFLHASPQPTYWQLHVPIVMWMSPKLRMEYPSLYANACKNCEKNVSTSRSVFDTMMELGGLRSKYCRPDKALTDSRFKETPRRYLTDHNTGVALTETGLKKPDYEMFKRKRISY